MAFGAATYDIGKALVPEELSASTSCAADERLTADLEARASLERFDLLLHISDLTERLANRANPHLAWHEAHPVSL